MKIFSIIILLNPGSWPGHDPSLLGNDLAVQRAGGGDADQRGGGDGEVHQHQVQQVLAG